MDPAAQGPEDEAQADDLGGDPIHHQRHEEDRREHRERVLAPLHVADLQGPRSPQLPTVPRDLDARAASGRRRNAARRRPGRGRATTRSRGRRRRGRRGGRARACRLQPRRGCGGCYSPVVETSPMSWSMFVVWSFWTTTPGASTSGSRSRRSSATASRPGRSTLKAPFAAGETEMLWPPIETVNCEIGASGCAASTTRPLHRAELRDPLAVRVRPAQRAERAPPDRGRRHGGSTSCNTSGRCPPTVRSPSISPSRSWPRWHSACCRDCVARQKPNPVKSEAYECGVEPTSDVSGRFPVRFYLVAMLFVIFDVEAASFYPWAVADAPVARVRVGRDADRSSSCWRSGTRTCGSGAVSSGGSEQRRGFLLTTVDSVARWAQSSSVWPLTMGLACCAIEMMTATAPEYDIARFGSEVFRASPRQADLMIVSGRVAQKMAPDREAPLRSDGRPEVGDLDGRLRVERRRLR